jgi:colanic acid biosynthesis glycosyl transferase WcaI
MRLLVVSQYFWPENFRINDLVAEMVRRGHEVTVLTGLPNYPDGRIFKKFRDDPNQFSNFEGANVVRVPLLPRGQGGLRLMLNYLSFAVSASTVGLWRLRGLQFDAIFAFEPSPITVGLPAALMRSVKKAPLAFWVLDLWPETLQAIGVLRSPVLLRFVGYLVSFVYRHCDLILAQSKSFVPQIEKYADGFTRVLYFPSWAESVFDMQSVEPAKEIAERPGVFNVVFAGNIGDAQDFPAILSAAEKLKPHSNIRWLLIGDGRMANWVAQEIERRQLKDCVYMLGRHPLEKMPSFFKHAGALLVSLKDEAIFSMTIPGKLQSYLAAGIPVLAMLNGEGADLVKSSGAGLSCSAGDFNGLAAAALKLSEMTIEERKSMGLNALSVSAQEFDRSRLMNKFESWIRHLQIKAIPR